MIDVVLVDGTGRPKIIPLPDDVPPAFVGYAHEGVKSGPFRAVRFDLCPGCWIDDRAVYRRVGCGDPKIRSEYLVRSTIAAPFNGLKLEP